MKSTTIAAELRRQYGRTRRLPEDRLIRRWMNDWKTDQSGPWQMDANGDPGILLPVLRDVVVATRGKTTNLTKWEAEELTRLGRGAPGMPPIGMYHWALAMIAARAAGEPVDSLEHYVAFRPWADKGTDYVAAFNAGWITEIRSFCPGDEAWLPLDIRRRVDVGLEAVIVSQE